MLLQVYNRSACGLVFSISPIVIPPWHSCENRSCHEKVDLPRRQDAELSTETLFYEPFCLYVERRQSADASSFETSPKKNLSSQQFLHPDDTAQE